MIKKAVFGVGFMCVCLASVHASPGGVDANGCHKSATSGHHCHPERATGRGTSQAVGGHETAVQREKRLKRECKGRPNAGACLGYAT